MKRIVRYLVVILLASALILIGCSSPSTSPDQTPQVPSTSQAIQLKFAHSLPPVSYFGTALGKWAQEVGDASNGEVVITLYPSGSLVKQQDEYDAVLSGLCDMVLLQPDITAGRFPLSGLDTLPMLFPSAEALGSVYWDILEKYYFTTDFSKVKVLWVQAMPPMQTISNKPIQTLADFQGLKWRVEGKIESWTMTAFGASPSVIDLSEAYTALDKGVVDGINFLYEGILAFGFNQITKYRTESNLMCRGFIIIMNLDKWNSLPQDVKDIFTKLGGKEYSKTAGLAGDEATKGPKQTLIDYDQKVGNPPITILSADEKAKWQAVCQTVWQRWAEEKDAAGLPGSTILKETQDLVKAYAK